MRVKFWHVSADMRLVRHDANDCQRRQYQRWYLKLMSEHPAISAMKLPHQLYPEKHEKWLPDGARLWRYVPLRTLFFYLNGNVFMPSVERLRQADPFEGEFPFDTVSFNIAMTERYGNELDGLDDWLYRKCCTEVEQQQIDRNKNCTNYSASILQSHYFEFLRKTRFVWCWFFSQSESAAMWNVYGNQGAAIATTVGKLRQSLAKTERDFVFGQMRYVHVDRCAIRDRYSEDPKDRQFVLQPHFLKRREYDSEKEVRFVACGPESRDSGGICLGGIDPGSWIDGIRLWPNLTLTEESALKRAIAVFAPGIPCSRSDLMMNEDRFAAERSRVMEWAEHQWKECTDCIPPGLKQIV